MRQPHPPDCACWECQVERELIEVLWELGQWDDLDDDQDDDRDEPEPEPTPSPMEPAAVG
jgi:hypothetical protein